MAAGPGVVPFITRWTGEARTASPVVARDRRGIRYADERSYDRVDGVLWTRIPSQPGKGKPDFGQVHSLRQRLAMARSQCQICGGPADRDPDGTLWLVDAQSDALRATHRTIHPPVCEPCAHRSVRACPHLRKAWTALRVRSVTPWGVMGAYYVSYQSELLVADAGTYAFTDPRLPWVRASQLRVELRDFTVVHL